MEDKAIEKGGQLVVDLIKQGVAGLDVLFVLVLFVVTVWLFVAKDRRLNSLEASLKTLEKKERGLAFNRVCKSRSRAGWTCLMAALLMIPITFGLIFLFNLSRK